MILQTLMKVFFALAIVILFFIILDWILGTTWKQKVAKARLYWHLSKFGKKIDLYLIKRRKNEFHRSLNTDPFWMMDLDGDDKKKYMENLVWRRSVAHEMDKSK